MRPGRWTVTGRGQAAFPVPVANVRGNNLPGFTGAMDLPSRGAPGPYTGGNVGGSNDMANGADPRADKMQPSPHVFAPNWAKRGWGGSGGWEPTVVYLLILIVAEMIVFGFISRMLR